MTLIWKLLRQHISLPQFVGFFFANLIGMLIVMLAIQFYTDTRVLYTSEDSFMKEDYLILNKEVSSASIVNPNANAFQPSEVDEIAQQSFADMVGTFQSSSFKVKAHFGLNGSTQFTTDLFFEAVPDTFVDVKSSDWNYRTGEKELPIILPRTYLDLYNYGFAQSQNMPKISEGLLSALKMTITITTDHGETDEYNGHIVGFSSRLNTILVPKTFLTWAETNYASSHRTLPTRLIVRVNNPTDKHIAPFLETHKYQTDEDKLQTSKINYVLRVIIGVVMIVGLIISALSFYVLMLSVFLLVQKNSRKLQNLLLIGYSPTRVALPYQLLTIVLNTLVFIFAALFLLLVRHTYWSLFQSFFPNLQTPSMLFTLLIGILLMLLVIIFNCMAIRHKVFEIWKNQQ